MRLLLGKGSGPRRLGGATASHRFQSAANSPWPESGTTPTRAHSAKATHP